MKKKKKINQQSNNGLGEKNPIFLNDKHFFTLQFYNHRWKFKNKKSLVI